MKALAITERGIESITLLELDELIKAKGKIEERVVIFEPKTKEDLMKFCYFTQSSARVLLFFDAFEFETLDDIKEKAGSILTKANLELMFGKEKTTTFRAECERIGSHDFGSTEAAKILGEAVVEETAKKLGFEPKANLSAPDSTIYCFINDNKAYLGLDLIGRDLNKRHYRIFAGPGTLNACVLYATLRFSGYTPKQKLLDVFSGPGIICIEAAICESRKSINQYTKDFAFRKLNPMKVADWDSFFKKLDSEKKEPKLDLHCYDPLLRNLEAARKNAKLAGVDKLINFSKMDIEWMDTKVDENSIDLIVSRIPCASKHTPEERVKKTYKELFYQAEFILKKKARMTLISEKMSLLREMLPDKFKIVEERQLSSGKQDYELVIIEKQ